MVGTGWWTRLCFLLLLRYNPKTCNNFCLQQGPLNPLNSYILHFKEFRTVKFTTTDERPIFYPESFSNIMTLHLVWSCFSNWKCIFFDSPRLLALQVCWIQPNKQCFVINAFPKPSCLEPPDESDLVPFSFQSPNYFVKGRKCDLPDVWNLRHRKVKSWGLDGHFSCENGALHLCSS